MKPVFMVDDLCDTQKVFFLLLFLINFLWCHTSHQGILLFYMKPVFMVDDLCDRGWENKFCLLIGTAQHLFIFGASAQNKKEQDRPQFVA